MKKDVKGRQPQDVVKVAVEEKEKEDAPTIVEDERETSPDDSESEGELCGTTPKRTT